MLSIMHTKKMRAETMEAATMPVEKSQAQMKQQR